MKPWPTRPSVPPWPLHWLGGRPYPKDRLTNAWTLVMGGQFHDLIPGTATPKAYEYAWNDESIAMNQFGGVLQSAADAVGSGSEYQDRGHTRHRL